MKKYAFLLQALPLIVTSLFANLAFAQTPPEPSICPTGAAIAAVGVSRNVAQDEQRFWFAGRRDQLYGTADHWTFVVGRISAANSNDAYNKASTGLKSLAFITGPLMGPLGKWICSYSTNEGYQAVAVNPPIATNAALYLKH